MQTLKMIRAAKMLEGAGFEVKRPFPSHAITAIGPFILLDHIGPTDIAPGKAVGAPTHPHVGIETLTYFIDGEGMHLDSLGNQAVTGPGEAQWMRAGRGIIHDEGPTEHVLKQGGRSHMAQLWLNMPGESKKANPDYRSFKASDFSDITTDSASIKVIAGNINGQTGPLQTFADPSLAFIALSAGGKVSLEIENNIESAIYVLTGSINISDQVVAADTLACMPQGTTSINVTADADTELLLLGGPEITDKLVRHGPFVTNSNAEMHQAIMDFQQGKFGTIKK